MNREGSEWDWDIWVESFLDFHVDSIAERLHNRPEAVAWREERARAAQAAAAAARAQITIDQEYGVMPAGLCWVCAAERVETATRTSPTFRACRWCRIYDMQQGHRLGLRKVLPLMEYPLQPVLRGRSFPRDPSVVAALGTVWSQVSVLDSWRASVVRAVLAMQAWPEDVPITLPEFQAFLPSSARGSRMAWWAYVDRRQPALAAVLDALPAPEQLQRPSH